MLESPDYFFRVREIGRLRQTTLVAAALRSNLAKTRLGPGEDTVLSPMAKATLGINTEERLHA